MQMWLCLELCRFFDIHRIKSQHLQKTLHGLLLAFLAKQWPSKALNTTYNFATLNFLLFLFQRTLLLILCPYNVILSVYYVWFPFLSGKLPLIFQSQASVTCLKSFLTLQAEAAISFFMFPQQLVHVLITELIRWVRSYFFTPLLLLAIHLDLRELILARYIFPLSFCHVRGAYTYWVYVEKQDKTKQKGWMILLARWSRLDS